MSGNPLCLACGAELHPTADGWADDNGSTTCPRRGRGEHQVEQIVPDETSYDPDWIDHKEPVTPDDIRLLHQQALDAGCDPDALERGLAAAIREAGSIEDLARQWTHRNEMRRMLAEFRAQIRRNRRPPAKPPLTDDLTPKRTRKDDKRRLQELVRKYPDLAREALTGGDAT
ncbi:hypothetical protein [Nonomuraea candida]|uniref:hypothetical protein n=1 Tax=Nonomuraea candida TaxID=359159 RepID=UPI0005BBC99E|nr:hypothetical protein [Nonomuraea candida]